MAELDPDAYAVKEFGTRGEKIKYIVGILPEKFWVNRISYQAVGKALTAYGFDTTYFAAEQIPEDLEDGRLLIRLFHLCKTVNETKKVSRSIQDDEKTVEVMQSRIKSSETRKKLMKAKSDPDKFLFDLLLGGAITKEQMEELSKDKEKAVEFISDYLSKEGKDD